jgi:hypothetical protein
MRRAILIPALGLLVACGESTVAVEGSCVAAVNIDGTTYHPASLPPVLAEDVGAFYVEVTLNTGCLDQGEPPVELGHGESNFLEVGTKIHRVDGFEPEERLALWAPIVGEWSPLVPHPVF